MESTYFYSNIKENSIIKKSLISTKNRVSVSDPIAIQEDWGQFIDIETYQPFPEKKIFKEYILR